MSAPDQTAVAAGDVDRVDARPPAIESTGEHAALGELVCTSCWSYVSSVERPYCGSCGEYVG